MGFTAAVIGGSLLTVGLPIAAGVGGGIALGSLLSGSAKQVAGQVQQAPKAPSYQDSLKQAKDAAANRRRVALLTGGRTSATGPMGAPVPAEAVRTKTLLGQ